MVLVRDGPLKKVLSLPPRKEDTSLKGQEIVGNVELKH
jgi:hypothetical protein